MGDFIATHVITKVEPCEKQKFHNPAHDDLLGHRCSFQTAETGLRCMFLVEDSDGGIHYVHTSPVESIKQNEGSITLTTAHTKYELTLLDKVKRGNKQK